MDLEFLNNLNEAQRQAVEYIDGPSLVIAGAGSGKTRVLTYKIAYLLMNGYKPWEIMALTFTNKAAKEMKERITRLLDGNTVQNTARDGGNAAFREASTQNVTKDGGSASINMTNGADGQIDKGANAHMSDGANAHMSDGANAHMSDGADGHMDKGANAQFSNRARYLRMGTFHSVFAQILRREADKIGYQRNFTIYDETDSRSLCKALIKELGLDDKIYKPGTVHNIISSAKNRLLSPLDYSSNRELQARDADSKMPQMAVLYNLYNQRCRTSNAMDFDDLLMNTYLLFHNNEDVRQQYANSFRFILVDEYQDTNYAQQQIVMQLAGEHKHVCVVGDDAQSIYGFRGANIDNILDFQEQYEGARLFKLEQNYRSTQKIVEAANSLIHKNERQIRKDVYSKNDEGENLMLQELASDREEAMFVSKDIRRRMQSAKCKVQSEECEDGHVSGGFRWSDFAVLYRTNSQSRVIEEQLMKDGVPARVYGGLSFYARKEIKDIVAYLRVVANPNDEEALKRIINYPARGIGDTTVQKILKAASANGCSMWEVIVGLTSQMENGEWGMENKDYEAGAININKGAITKLNGFRTLIEGYIARLDTDDAYTLGTDIVKSSGISQDLYSSKEPEYVSKQENMEEFVNSMHEFVEVAVEEERPTGLLDYLQEVALISDTDRDDDRECVKLMTIHAAKGLEFPCVYVVGLEENIFPSPMCIDSKRELEEERRLLYVAITRAEKYCVLTHARMRFRYGNMEFEAPSRFLRDIDSRLINVNGRSTVGKDNGYGNGYATSRYGRENRVGLRADISRPSLRPEVRPQQQRWSEPQNVMPKQQGWSEPQPDRPLRPVTSHGGGASVASIGELTVGDAVQHDRFGRGVIQKLDGIGDSAKATVEFQNAGKKQLLLKFAKLKKC